MLNVLIWEKLISISSGFMTTDNNTLTAVSTAGNIATETIDRVCKTLLLSLFACFLCKLPLIFSVDRKWKKAGDICMGTLNIEFEQDWSVGLVVTLGDVYKTKNYFFLVSGIFFRKELIVSYYWGSDVL